MLGLTRGVLAAILNRPAVRPDFSRVLAAFLDTLLPADRWSPSATQLGIGARLIEMVMKDPPRRRGMEQGFRWLDGAARRLGAQDFAALPEDRREALVALMAAAAPGSPQRSFFETTRSDAFFHYYAREEAWSGLGYDGPPQPAGFPDHAGPPGEPR